MPEQYAGHWGGQQGGQGGDAYQSQQAYGYWAQQGYYVQDPAQAEGQYAAQATGQYAAPSAGQYPAQGQPYATAQAAPPPEEPEPSSFTPMLAVLAVILVVAVAGGLYWHSTLPVCGNGRLEEGETSGTCCPDAGCTGDQSCEEGTCVDPECGPCQYLDDHVCRDHECCSDDECPGDSVCRSNTCVPLDCGGCLYAEGHSCLSHTCCTDEDCDDGMKETTDKCRDPSTTRSLCVYSATVDLGPRDLIITLGAGDGVRFEHMGTDHVVTVQEIGTENVTVEVSSDPQNVTLKVSETKDIDLDKDDDPDITLSLISIKDKRAEIQVGKYRIKTADVRFVDYENTKFGIKMKYPSTWRLVENQLFYIAVFGAGVDKTVPDNLRPLVSVTSERIPEDITGLEAFKDQWIEESSASMSDFTVLDLAAEPEEGSPPQVLFKARQGESVLMSQAVFAEKHGVVYLIMYISWDRLFSRHLDLVEEMVSSFEITAGPETEASANAFKLNEVPPVGTTADGKRSVFRSDRAGIGFTYPIDWSVIELVKGASVYQVSTPKEDPLDKIVEGLTVVVKKMTGDPEGGDEGEGDIEAVKAAIVQQIKAQVTDADILSIEEETIGGDEALQIVYTGTQLGEKVKFKQVLMERGRNLVTCIYTADLDTFTVYETEMDAVIASINATSAEVTPDGESGDGVDAGCDAFPDKLGNCTAYKCRFTHPFTKEPMVKEISGLVDGKCDYVEEMPNDGKMECSYSESARTAVAQYHRDVATAESAGTEVNVDLGSGEVKTTYTIDGKEVENPLQEAMDNGQCVISGY